MAAAGDDPRPLPEDARARRRGPGSPPRSSTRRRRSSSARRAPSRPSRATAASRARSAPRPTRWSSTGSPGPTSCKRGDLLSIDVGVIKDGWVADAAMTVPIGPITAEAEQAARGDQGARSSPGSSRCAPATTSATSPPRSSARSRPRASRSSAPWSATGSAARCTRSRRCRTSASPGEGPELEEGMVLAIEPMVNAGGPLVRMGDDGWAVYSEDGSLAAHFEFTVAVTADGPRVLTPWHELSRDVSPSLHRGLVLERLRLGRRDGPLEGGALRSTTHSSRLRFVHLASLRFCACWRLPRRRRRAAALRHQRRRRLPQRPAARGERPRQRSSQSSPSAASSTPARRTTPTSSRSTKASSTARPTLTDDADRRTISRTPPSACRRAKSSRRSNRGPGVTIIRDTAYGVPHIYGDTRADTMFGAGYAGASDRLFLMDVLRHTGRAELASFLGGSNAAPTPRQWGFAPYTEADLQKQLDAGAEDLRRRRRAGGRRRQRLRRRDQRLHRRGQRSTRAEAGRVRAARPSRWNRGSRPTSIAIASLVGGIFGRGGGNELNSALTMQAFVERMGRKAGRRAWLGFRSKNDPEAPTTISKPFPYETRSAFAQRGLALPDRARSTRPRSPRPRRRAGAASRTRLRRPPRARRSQRPATPPTGSWSRPELAAGHPIAVMGPQVGYYVPQILMEEDLHGPGIDARGAAFAGVNLYVQLGHGRDYAWSATRAELRQRRHLRRGALPGPLPLPVPAASAGRWKSWTRPRAGRRTRSTRRQPARRR